MIQQGAEKTTPQIAAGRAQRALGNNTESSPPLEAEKLLRFDRYRLLNSARELLFNQGVKEGFQYPANYHRTAKCIHTRLGDKVQVYKSVQHKKAFYGGVVSCGKAFTCPVCAAKIQERRRLEIAQAFDYTYNEMDNKKVILVTVTFPHTRHDKLHDLLKMQSEALAKFRKGNVWDKRKAKIGFSGLIRSLEVTFSTANGWHPHTHEAWIVNKDVDTDFLRGWLANRWYNVCVKSGLVKPDYKKQDHFYQHSIQITDNASNSDYLAKMDSSKYWGADRELASSSVKQAKGKGFHPFQLLDLADSGCRSSGRFYVQFADAMRGKTQIFWSKGLKNTVGVNDVTDEEIVEEKEDKADLLGHLTKDHWRFITSGRHQATALSLAETSGFYALVHWIENSVSVIPADDTQDVPSESRATAKRISEMPQSECETIHRYNEILKSPKLLYLSDIKHNSEYVENVVNEVIQDFENVRFRLQQIAGINPATELKVIEQPFVELGRNLLIRDETERHYQELLRLGLLT